MSSSAVDAFDAAIILGARVMPDGTPSPAMARRVARGVDLLRRGAARALLMSGGVTTSAVAEAEVMRDLALALGAPSGLVHLEPRALNTIQNALYSRAVARAQGWHRLLVVTDSFHRPRTRYIFRRAGLAVTVVGVRPDQPTAEWWLAHAREGLALPWTVLRVEARRLGDPQRFFHEGDRG